MAVARVAVVRAEEVLAVGSEVAVKVAVAMAVEWRRW